MAYAFSDVNVKKLKQLGPDPEMLKSTEVLPLMFTKSQLLNEIFHGTLKIFRSLYPEECRELNHSMSLQTFLCSKNHML